MRTKILLPAFGKHCSAAPVAWQRWQMMIGSKRLLLSKASLSTVSSSTPPVLPWAKDAPKSSWSLRATLFSKKSDADDHDEMSSARLEQLAHMTHILLPSDPAELERLRGEMSRIIRFTHRVKTAADSLMNETSDSNQDLVEEETVLREDEVLEGGNASIVLSNASHTTDNHFVVLKPS